MVGTAAQGSATAKEGWSSRSAFILAAVGAAHLVAQLLGLTTAAGATQVLLMPVLAAGLWASTSPPRPRMIRVVLAALGLSWLGDAIPRFVDGEAGFLGMLGSFLIAQMIYAIAFWPLRHRSVLRRPVAVLPYVAVAGAIIAATAPAADALVPALVVYAAAIAEELGSRLSVDEAYDLARVLIRLYD